MSFLVISRVEENEILKGFVLVSDSGKVDVVSLEKLQTVCSSRDDINFYNAEYDPKYKTLVGTQGSLTKYPSVDKDFNIISKNGITVFKTIAERGTGKPLGCVVYNALGVRSNVTFSKLQELSKRNINTNYDLKFHKDYGMIAVGKDGSMFPCVEMLPKNNFNVYDSKSGESKPSIVEDLGKDKLPAIRVYSMDNVKNSEFSKSANEKFLLATMNMFRLTPYYHCLFQSIIKKPAVGLGTLAVTEDTLYYDLKFVAELTTSELTFVFIHEILHIAMQHSVRYGRRTNHDLWNIACDLYINTIICKDFGVRFGGGEVNIGTEVSPIVIKTPNDGIFLETINETLDLSRDTPESIYGRLLKENPNGASSGDNSNSKGSDSNTSSDSGNSSSDSESSEGENQSSDDVFDNENQNKTGGTSNDGNDELEDSSSNGDTKPKKVTVTYNGKKLTVTIMNDIISSTSEDTKEADAKRLEASKNALQKMETKVKLEEQKLGHTLERAGAGGSLTQRYIEFGLSSNVDWRVLLKNVCKSKPKKTFTLASPNQDYMNLGMTIADRRNIGKSTHISDIKIAIDVSGSVSEKKLNLYLSEVNNIFRFYKVDGELIYWSTMIGDAGDFSSVKDLLKVAPKSTGGTDVKCVFDYLSGKTKVHGQFEKTKIKDMSCVFIVTDGHFSDNYAEYGKYFGKKVIWLLDGNPVLFNPPFGRVIGL